MIAVKTSRRLKLHEDEEDSLLPGVDFQAYYLGNTDVLVSGKDIDDVVEDIYARYSTSDDLNNSDRLAVTVDAHQLVFFNVASNEIEFVVALTDIQSIHSGNKRNKFPNAITLVTCVQGVSTKAHVLHCTNQRKAKELHGAINRAFKYRLPDVNSIQGCEEKGESLSKRRNGKVQSSHDDTKVKMKYTKAQEEVTLNNDTVTPKGQSDETSSKTGLKSLLNSKLRSDSTESPSDADVTRVRSKGRVKSIQTKGAEGLGLLENIDPEEDFEDEFTSLARSRSLSETIKSRFGR